MLGYNFYVQAKTMLSDDDAKEILTNFPSVEFAFAYGSGDFNT